MNGRIFPLFSNFYVFTLSTGIRVGLCSLSFRLGLGLVFAFYLLYGSIPVEATDYLSLAKEGSYIIKNFKFKSGGELPELRINYATWGEPKKDEKGNVTNAVLLCHGTTGNWQNYANPWWASKMYGPGQPLDISKYFVIASDTIGSGKSSKPSDGLRMKFPKFIIEDVVKAQYILLTEGLGVNHLQAVIGISFGGRQAWQWGVQYPDFMEGIIPIASSPFPNAGRRGMTDFLGIAPIIQDPTWKNGDYQEQPRNFHLALMFYWMFLDGAGHLWEEAPTRKQSFKYLPEVAKWWSKNLDANDWIYLMQVNDGFDAYSQLDEVKAQVLIINMAGDEQVPVELHHAEKAVEKLGDKAEYLLVKEFSEYGHFATSRTLDIYGPKIGEFLKKLATINKRG
jgi:homoserine O-acetyltransferase